MENNENIIEQDELYAKATDLEFKLDWITPGDYQTVEEYLEAKAEARVERDLAWSAYEDSL
jgi:hypothetical protein